MLFQSRKPIAKQFKKQVKGILKALRQNKIQMTNTTNDNQVGNNINGMNEMLNAITNLINQQNEIKEIKKNINISNDTDIFRRINII